jgi:hypothetical protein
MLTASQSQSSALGARRRKVEESDAGAIYRFILLVARLRQENLLSAIEEEDWGEIAAKVLARARLPAAI